MHSVGEKNVGMGPPVVEHCGGDVHIAHVPSSCYEGLDHPVRNGLVVPHMLAIGDLESGRLIAPFGFAPGERQLSLWIAPHLASRSDLKTLEKWLSQELREGLKRASKLSLPRGS